MLTVVKARGPAECPSTYRQSDAADTLVRSLKAVRQLPGIPPLSTAPSTRDERLTRAKALMSGVATRRHVHVRSVAPGMILVRVAGDARCFARVGMDDAFSDGPDMAYQRLAYVSVAWPQHQSRVLGGNAGLSSVDALANEAFGASNGTGGAVINGAFFNFQRRTDAGHPEHAPIGALRASGRCSDGLPLPAAYLDDYVGVRFDDGSHLETAPMLSARGNAAFTRERLAGDAYHLPPDFSFASACIHPGELQHAADPNPRAAISLPMAFQRNNVRLVVGMANGRGSTCRSGYSLPAWAGVMARIDRLDALPHQSVNLDGGNSIALVISDGEGRRYRIGQPQEDRHIASAIAFVRYATQVGPSCRSGGG
ncbi:phosphodiester glycosidase family protein [Pandoraea norimbergensis]